MRAIYEMTRNNSNHISGWKIFTAVLTIVLSLGIAGAKPAPSDQSEVRSAVLRIFNQLKSREYGALYDGLPSSSRSRISRDRFITALQRAQDFYRLDSIEVGAINVSGDLAVVDTVMYAHITKPIDGDGKLVAQQYLIKENGTWRVATGDRATIDRFLKNNPGFARKFPIKRTRAYLKQNGKWIEIPLGAARPRR